MISGANNGAGCLAGIARGNCTISNCTLLEGNYKCTLSGDGNADFLAFGGLVGTSDASTTFTGCTSKGNLSFEIGSSKTAVAGGIIGCCYDFDTQLALCINVGMVSGENGPHNGAICGMGYSGGPFSYEGGVCYRCIWTGDMPICYSQTDSRWLYRWPSSISVNHKLGIISLMIDRFQPSLHSSSTRLRHKQA